MTDTVQARLTANLKASGCASKLSSLELARLIAAMPRTSNSLLLTNLDNFEDAAVYKITDDVAVVQTVDFFPAPVDDPFLFGQISAANALSDIYAMGGVPVLALNMLCFPICNYPFEIVEAIMRGGLSKVTEAGAILAGGHSIQSTDPVYGLCVTGIVHPGKMLTNSGARVGDVMVLTKPIGTGVALLGFNAGFVSDAAGKELLANMTRLNDKALEMGSRYSVHAATDITGFGLIGHVHEMAIASGLSACIFADNIPLLPECLSLAKEGFVPAGAYGNRKSFESFVSYVGNLDLSLEDLLFDPQTSGGLLFAVPSDEATLLVADLRKEGINAGLIGQFKDGEKGRIEVGAYAQGH